MNNKQEDDRIRKGGDTVETITPITPGQDMVFSEKEWDGVLEALRFREQENVDGGFTIYDKDSFPLLQYKTMEEKERAYYFLMGMEFQQILKNVPECLLKLIL